jgi:hypothetical protein
MHSGVTLMSIAEEWERFKTEFQRDAERLMGRSSGTEMRTRIETDLKAVLHISDPTNDQEMTSRRKIYDLLRAEWRTAVMDNTRFKNKPASG